MMTMTNLSDFFGLIIIGGGPAGIAPILAAHRTGELDALLAGGVAVVEQSMQLGSGLIGGYDINSDSSGRTFVDCLLADRPSDLTRLTDDPLTQTLAAAGDAAVPLHDAGRFLCLVGDTVGRMLERHHACALFLGHQGLSVTRVHGGWSVRLRNLSSGVEQTLQSRSILIATGGHQPAERLADEQVGGFNLSARCDTRLLQSGAVLADGGLKDVAERLAGIASPHVAIIGGSTSAAAVAHALLYRRPDIRFGDGGVTLLHRRPLRIYYPDRAAALADGYDEWTEDDICPISGRVFRFAGFRLDSGKLVKAARGIGNTRPEPRLRLHQVGIDDAEAMRIVDEADLVVAALGYRPRGLQVHDRNGVSIDLLAQTSVQAPLVDDRCRVLDAGNHPIPGLFGIGLAAGFVPRGALGGEPSFRGQANGLWLWQHDVGSLIVDAAIATMSDARRSWNRLSTGQGLQRGRASKPPRSVAYR